MPKRFLILSASTGAGHVRAGEALRASSSLYAPSAVVEHHDIAELLSRPMREILINSYNRLTPLFPDIWGMMYRKTNTQKNLDRLGALPKLLRHIPHAPIERFVREWNPTHIICTHFLPPLFLGRTIPVSTVITDFAVHTFWLSGNPIRYFVSTDRMTQDLVKLGVAHASVTVSGIPIHPSFFEQKSEEELRRRLSIPKDKKAVLVLSGGYGLIPTDGIVKALFAAKEPMMIVAIAGKNQALKHRLDALVAPPHMRLLSIRWTENMDEYMRLADIVIGKPGGLTTTECIAMGKPLIAVQPIPGHEDANIRYLEARGYGVLAKDIHSLLLLVSQSPMAIAPGYKKNPPDRADSGKIIWEKIVSSECYSRGQ